MAKKATTVTPVSARRYFLTYLLPSGFTDSELNTFKKEVAELVTKHKGSVVATEEWGKQKMAYKIKHANKWHTEAVYVHLVLSVEPTQINALEHDVYLNTHILRHLLVIADEVQPEQKTQAKPEEKDADEVSA